MAPDTAPNPGQDRVTDSAACGDFITLVGMAHPVYCYLEAAHVSDHAAATRIAGGGTADVRWEDGDDE